MIEAKAASSGLSVVNPEELGITGDSTDDATVHASVGAVESKTDVNVAFLPVIKNGTFGNRQVTFFHFLSAIDCLLLFARK